MQYVEGLPKTYNAVDRTFYDAIKGVLTIITHKLDLFILINLQLITPAIHLTASIHTIFRGIFFAFLI